MRKFIKCGKDYFLHEKKKFQLDDGLLQIASVVQHQDDAPYFSMQFRLVVYSFVKYYCYLQIVLGNNYLYQKSYLNVKLSILQATQVYV